MKHKVQIDDVIRDADEHETAMIEQLKTQEAAEQQAAQDAAAAKQSARAKLKALGLTDAEIAALVG